MRGLIVSKNHILEKILENNEKGIPNQMEMPINLVTRTGIENPPLFYLIFSKFERMRKTRHFGASYKNSLTLIYANFL